MERHAGEASAGPSDAAPVLVHSISRFYRSSCWLRHGDESPWRLLCVAFGRPARCGLRCAGQAACPRADPPLARTTPCVPGCATTARRRRGPIRTHTHQRTHGCDVRVCLRPDLMSLIAGICACARSDQNVHRRGRGVAAQHGFLVWMHIARGPHHHLSPSMAPRHHTATQISTSLRVAIDLQCSTSLVAVRCICRPPGQASDPFPC
ncbi:hypothetical protein BC834DRAFT_521128 [Gloeopeniophorella convolvens]|nr:hypothetical protein BC834DRAFT_521128 [Gloeopeniophorella convolvens]